MGDTRSMALVVDVLLQHFGKLRMMPHAGVWAPAGVSKMAVYQYALIICNKYHYFPVFLAKAFHIQVPALYLEYLRRIGMAEYQHVFRFQKLFKQQSVFCGLVGCWYAYKA